MSLSSPNNVFGIHSASMYNNLTGIPYGILKVLQGSTFTIAAEQVALNGGSFRFPWQIEDGNFTSEVSIVTNEYPEWLSTVALGKTPTENAAETGGFCSTLVNQSGTGMVAATGIATATVKAGVEADVKFENYVVVAVDATTVDVYGSSDIDYTTGTDLAFVDDSLKITASPLTITTSTAVEIPGTGIELTGDSGTIALVAGETAIFNTRSINSGSSEVVVGGVNDIFPTVGLRLLAQKNGVGDLFLLDCYSVKLGGLPFALNTKAFSEAEITGQAFYNSAKGGIFKETIFKA